MAFVEAATERFKEASQSYLGIFVGIIVVYQIAHRLQCYFIAKKLGCKPIRYKVNDHALGFRAAKKLLEVKSEGLMTEYTFERFEETGDTLAVRMAGNTIISTRDPENIKAVLATQFNDYELGIRHRQFLPLLGDGIFTLDNEGWKHSRAMLRPQFAREQVAHVKSLEPHIQNLYAHIRKAPGSCLDLQELFFRFTLDTATEFLFGESVECLLDGIDKHPSGDCDAELKKNFAHAFNDAQNTLATRAVFQKLYWLVNNSNFRKNCKGVHDLTDFFVDKALNTSSEELEKVSKDGYIFLYELVKQTRDPKILRDQALNILLAGRDTTAGLLSFTFFELARNKNVWEKLKEEIHGAFGKGEDARIEDITFESLKKCEYLKAVINETLRLYPSVPVNFRTANKHTSIPRGGGKDGLSPVFVEKGATVNYSIASTQRSEKYYGKDAAVFRPERWFEESTKKLGWAYLPFNGGPRICLGQQFALTEASYVITRIAQQFSNLKDFNDTTYPPRKNSQLTMCLMDGCNIGLS